MIDTNNFSVFGIAPYYFFAGLGLVFAFAFYILNVSFSGKNVNKHAIILFLSFIGLGIGAVAFGCLSKICIAIYTNSSILSAFASGVGIVFYGGMTGFVFTFMLLQKKLNKTVDRTVVNILAVSIPLFHAFARVGCFFAGCCYGSELNTFISVNYILRGSSEIISVFPVQLVEAILNFVLFLVLWYILKKHSDKVILPIYLFSYAIYRFLLEFLRGDTYRGKFGLLSFSQIYSLLIIITIVLFRFRKDRKNGETV